MDMSDGGHMDHSHPVSFTINMTFPLFLHLLCFFVSFGLVYPYSFACKRAGMSQRHLIFQIVGAALGIVGFITGHFSGFAWYNSWYADIGCIFSWGITAGSFLLLIYVPKGVLSHMRNAIDVVHTAASVAQPLVCWVTTGLSVISLLQYCGSEGDHVGQCLAHGIMGTAFVTYGVLLLLMMFCGDAFLQRINRSQECLDSWTIMIWGIINTFTEHRWGRPWGHGDVQHTSMGVVWWAMGALGVYMSWDRVNDRPKRNHLPALIILATGYAMMTHTQHLMVSTQVHFMFGVMLSFTALARIIEISFVLKDTSPKGTNPNTWQYLTPMFMIMSGMMFMSATEEAMEFLHEQSIMPAPYVLLIASVASLIFLSAIFVIQSYIKMRAVTDDQFLSKEETEDGMEMPFLQTDGSRREADLNHRDFEISE